MGEFTSKPQIVEAVQWTGTNYHQIGAAFPGKVQLVIDGGADRLELLAGVDGVQGWVHVPTGHWLVHPPGDITDVWPVEDTYFQEKYGANDARQGDYAIGSDVWDGASKVVEEMGELLQVFGKLIGCGGSNEYWGGLNLRDKLVEELGDLRAAIRYFEDRNLTAEEVTSIDNRSYMKLYRFEDWANNGHDPKDVTRDGFPDPIY